MINVLVKGFDPDIFNSFIQKKFSSFSSVKRKIPLKEEYPWNNAQQLGFVKSLPGSDNLNQPLIIVTAQLPDGDTLMERNSRIKQLKFAKEVLDRAMSNPTPGVEGVLSQGLFVFADDSGNFRLSLVYGHAEGTKLIWSTVRRMSFHVETGTGNKTFLDRMALNWSSFNKLKEAFSVEKLTKEFTNGLFTWYQQAMDSK
jgi:hypothetical protein